MIALLANVGEPSDWTLCAMPWVLVHVQVTVPPIATVSTAGLELPLWALVNAMAALSPTVTDPLGPPPPPPPPPYPPAPFPPLRPVAVYPPQPASDASAARPMAAVRK